MSFGTFDNYVSDFESTFSIDTKGRVKADVVEAERFLEKYRILIERSTDQYIEPLNMFKCIDFNRRIEKVYILGNITKGHLLCWVFC